MAKRGAKSKLTPETMERICRLVREGNTYRVSAVASGIDEKTFHNWLRQGRLTTSGVYFEFFQQIKKAEAEAAVAMMGCVRDAAPKSWQAATWWLERRLPAEYANNKDTIRELEKMLKEIKAELDEAKKLRRDKKTS